MSADFHPPGAKPATGEMNNDGLPLGTWKSEYPNGSKAAEVTYDQNGRGSGKAQQWYEDGAVAVEVEFSNNGEDNIQRTFYPNGQLQSQATFVQGISHGPLKNWYPNGKLSADGQLHLGRPHGKVREFSPTGECTEEVFVYGVPQDKRFQLISILKGGLPTLALLIAVLVGATIMLLREGSALHGLLLLALVLVIHEFGHWIVARWAKIPVESFRVGVGPHLTSFMWAQTRFEIHLLPLIGWVKQATFWPGEFEKYQQYATEASIPTSPQGREGVPDPPCPPSAACKFVSPGRRVAFYLGGIAINLLTAFLVLWLSTYPTRPHKAAAKCAQIGTGIALTVPIAITEQLNPKNIVKDTPGLIRGVRDASRSGITFGQSFAVVSIVIAVFNLLPIPPLDGFHVATTVIEKVIGRKLEGPIYNAVSYIGVAFLLLLMLTGVFFLGRDLFQMILGR